MPQKAKIESGVDKQYEVLVPLSDGGAGAHPVGAVLAHSELAAYVTERNIKALIEKGVIKEVKE